MQLNWENISETSDHFHIIPQPQNYTDTNAEFSCSSPFFPHLPIPPQTNLHFSLHNHQQDPQNVTHQQYYCNINHNNYSTIFHQQHQTSTSTFAHHFFQPCLQSPPPRQSSNGSFKRGSDYVIPDNRPTLSSEFTPRFCRQTQEYPFSKDMADVREPCSELEIYGLVKNCSTNFTISTIGENHYNQLTGSGSAVTGENSPGNIDLTPLCEEETQPRKLEKKKRRRKRSEEEFCTSMAGFFESLVEQVMAHQERLHSGFLEAVERIDRERREREEEWRSQEALAQSRDAVARVHERALASSREALIISYLEKITAQILKK